MTAFLELRDLTMAFGDFRVLDGLDLSVEAGQVLAILGPSGCGKSTTLRIISGLLRQDSGEVWMDGRCIDAVPVHKREIGFLFQNYSLFPHLTVRRNIEFGLRMKGVDAAVRSRRVEELLVLIGLEGLGDRRPRELSGGQQQRVALARALAIEPKLLLLDEPFGALDAKIRRRLRRDLKVLQRELAVTTVFVTHDQEEAFEVGDQTAVMNDGVIEQMGTPRELYDLPDTSFVASFVGNVNVIHLPGEDGQEELEVIVRPENVKVEKVVGYDGRTNGKGMLASYVFLGSCIEATIDLDNGGNITSIMSKPEFIEKGLRRGDRLHVGFKEFRTFAHNNVDLCGDKGSASTGDK